MYYEPLETVYVNDKYRMSIYPDDSSEDPRLWEDELNIYVFNSDEIRETPKNWIERYFDEIIEHASPNERNPERVALRALRILKSFGAKDVPEYFDVVNLSTYRRYHQAFVYGDMGREVTACLKTFNDWLNGEVYAVTLEEKCECCGSHKVVDSVGGMYNYDEVAEFARELFSSTIENKNGGHHVE